MYLYSATPRAFCSVTIRYTGLPAAIAKSSGADIKFVRWVLQRMYLEIGRHWHRHIRPLHFRPGAAGKYGYMPRRRLYQQIKREEVGHTTELVHSGESQHETEHAVYKPTAKGVQVVMDGGNLTAGRVTLERRGFFRGREFHGNRYVFGARMKSQRRVMPTQMEEELTTVTDAEQRAMGTLGDRVATRYFNRVSGSHRVAV